METLPSSPVNKIETDARERYIKENAPEWISAIENILDIAKEGRLTRNNLDNLNIREEERLCEQALAVYLNPQVADRPLQVVDGLGIEKAYYPVTLSMRWDSDQITTATTVLLTFRNLDLNKLYLPLLKGLHKWLEPYSINPSSITQTQS